VFKAAGTSPIATYPPRSHPGGDVGFAHDRTFPLDQAPEAMRRLIEDRPYGKVTVVPTDSADADSGRRAMTVVCVVAPGRRGSLFVEGKPVVTQRSIGQQPFREIWQPATEQIAVKSGGRRVLARVACRLLSQLGADNRAGTP
jgi:hypothetical protein